MSERAPYNDHPPFENTATSIAAAASVEADAATMRAKVLQCIADAGEQGRTDDELEVLLDMIGSTVRPRRRELVLRGQVIDSGKVRDTRSGRGATVWTTQAIATPTKPCSLCGGKGWVQVNNYQTKPCRHGAT